MTRTDTPQELILGVPYLENKRAETISQVGFKIIEEWKLTDCITGLSMDTTTTNTGAHGGVCVFLQRKIDRKLIWFMCRHHVAELVLGSAIKLWDKKLYRSKR